MPRIVTPSELTQSLKEESRRLGFEFAGTCPAVDATGFSELCHWINSGYAGEMRYFDERRPAYAHPRHVHSPVASLLMLGTCYRGLPDRQPMVGSGRIASYALADADYHDVIRERLQRLGEHLERIAPNSSWRGVVDTAPFLEREFAQLAGLGWQGKNTLLLRKGIGSYFFLAAILTDAILEYDQPHATEHCGTCTRCLEACPTDAFVSPGVMDARRCISYLTIELRQPIPDELRPLMDDWIFGCDVCQDVCPWNRFAPNPAMDAFQCEPERVHIDLESLFDLDDDSFRIRFRRTPLWRAKRRGILRNAAIAMGNGKDPRHIATLIRALNDPEPLVRGAAVWALSRFESESARNAIAARLAIEQDPEVLKELSDGIGNQGD
jgi:epoxyqueuosine reductase